MGSGSHIISCVFLYFVEHVTSCGTDCGLIQKFTFSYNMFPVSSEGHGYCFKDWRGNFGLQTATSDLCNSLTQVENLFKNSTTNSTERICPMVYDFTSKFSIQIARNHEYTGCCFIGVYEPNTRLYSPCFLKHPTCSEEDLELIKSEICTPDKLNEIARFENSCNKMSNQVSVTVIACLLCIFMC